MTFKNSLFCICGLVLVHFFYSCNQNNESDFNTNASKIWGVRTSTMVVDSCFSPQRTNPPRGFLIIPETEGKEIEHIAFDPLDNNALYITTTRRTTNTQAFDNNSKLYRLDLNTNTSTLITTLVDFGTSDLMLNENGDLLSSAMGEGVTIFNIPNLSLVKENIKPYSSNPVWCTNETFWEGFSIKLNQHPFRIGARGLFSNDGKILDTLHLRNGLVSRLRNNRTIFSTRIEDRFSHSLFIHSKNENKLIDSIPNIPFQIQRLHSNLGQPFWLDDNTLFVNCASLFTTVDITSKTHTIVGSAIPENMLPEDCRNIEISSIQVVPNRTNEILYVLNQFFYNADGEYRKRHDIVHFNITTGEHRVLLVNL